MPDLRATIDLAQVLAFLKQHFDTPISDLTAIEGGAISRTFSFNTHEQAYIVRFNKDNMLTCNLPKEAYLYQKLAPLGIPFPPIVHAGRLGDLYVAISRKLPGHMLEQYSVEEVEQLIPQLIEHMDAIHRVDVSETTGFGVFDYQGTGLAKSWRDFLSIIAREGDEHDYFGKWHHLFEDSFLERELFKAIYRHMRRLLDYCPTERYLVHGDYNFHNILAQDGRITAILDWVDARYGDFVYDIAGLDFWCPWLHMPARCQQYYQQHGREVPFYQERLLCYQCYLALTALRFYATNGAEQSYQWTRENILRRLNSSSS